VFEKALQAGAKAYVLKSDAGEHLTNAVEALQQNKTYFNPRLGKILLGGLLDKGRMSLKGASILPKLTSREQEILQLLVGGISTKELAVSLGVTIRTAETHRSNLMRKLNLHSLSELVLYALRNNILQVAGEHSYGDRRGQTPLLAA
jgi:DNA-binding NarL/FixJ family response regulator